VDIKIIKLQIFVGKDLNKRKKNEKKYKRKKNRHHTLSPIIKQAEGLYAL